MLNKVILLGRLTKEPELKYTPSNIPVCSFSLAVNSRFTKEDAEQKADFFNIVAWRSTAEFVSKYFTKGLQVAICGRLQSRTWEGQEGKKHYVTEVVADEVYFADSKKDKPDISYSNNGDPMDNFMPPMDTDDDLP